MTNKKPKKKINKEYTAKVNISDLSRYEYDENAVLEILTRGNYEEFSIPLSINAKYIIVDEGAPKLKGTRTIGHVVSFNKDTREMVISIADKYCSSIDAMINGIEIIPGIRFDTKSIPTYVSHFNVEPANPESEETAE